MNKSEKAIVEVVKNRFNKNYIVRDKDGIFAVADKPYKVDGFWIIEDNFCSLSPTACINIWLDNNLDICLSEVKFYTLYDTDEIYVIDDLIK